MEENKTPPTIETERVDDLPLLFAQMERMGIADLLDRHFSTHGNWQGLSLGKVAVGWLSHMLSQGNHKLNHVQPWAESHLSILQTYLDADARVLDWSDDHLAHVLDYFADDEPWDAFEAELGRHLLRVYELEPKTVRLDSTASCSYGQITPDGLLQLGHSKDHRPDLGQVKVQLSALDPMGLPLTNTIVQGSSADDPLYVPEIKKVQGVLGKHGMLYVGDCKMGALATRGYVAKSGDWYCMPLSKIQLSTDELREHLEPVWSGKQTLTRVERSNEKGEKEEIASGFERAREQQWNGYRWQERVLIVRSLKLAQKQEQGLRERVEKAQAELLALNERGRGRRRLTDLAEYQKAAQAIVKRYRVEGLLTLCYQQQVHEQTIRGYGKREARVERECEVRVEVTVDTEALAAAIGLLGWQVYATNAPAGDFSLEKLVLTYRNEYLIEHDFGRLKGVPLSLRPLYLSDQGRLKGLLRLLTIGLRVLVLLEFEARRRLHGNKLAGLYAGQSKRATSRPTAEKLLAAFDGITLTKINQRDLHVTTLSPLQQRLLDLLGFPSDLSARLTAPTFAHAS
jgi:transposase